MNVQAFGPPLNINNVQRICCIGAGRVGVFSMLVLAHHWPMKTFIVVDSNPHLIHRWENELNPPFFETRHNDRALDLNHLLEDRKNVNLFFSNDIDATIQDCNVIFIAVDVPSQGGKGRIKDDFDLSRWEEAMRRIVSISNGAKYVVEKSTMPVDVGNKINEVFGQYPNHAFISVMSNPEFFSLGTAIPELMNPPKVIMANRHEGNSDLLRDLYLPVVGGDINRILVIDNSQSMQLGKLVLNAFLASQVTLMNIASSLCEKLGANFEDIKNIVASDPRVGHNFHYSRVGFGGFGLNKDMAYLMYLADFYGLANEASHFKNIIKLNKQKKDEFIETLLHRMISLKEKKLAIYGFSYKRGTDDIRGSSAIYICQQLLRQRGVRVTVYDPVVPNEKIRGCFATNAKLTVAQTMANAWHGANALIFLTNWDQFRITMENRVVDIFAEMRRPHYIFDCSDNNFNVVDLRLRRFNVYELGKA